MEPTLITSEPCAPYETHWYSCGAAALEKFEIFFIIPGGTQNYNSKPIRDFWVDLIGAERVIKIADPAAVCETIATTIGLMEGAVDATGIRADLADVGASATIVAAVTSGLDGLARSTAHDRVVDGSVVIDLGDSGDRVGLIFAVVSLLAFVAGVLFSA